MLQHFSSVFHWCSLAWSHVACVIRCSTKALWPPFITSILHQLKPLLPQMSIVTALWYRAKCIDFHFVHFSLTSTIHSLNKHLNMRPIMERKRKRVWVGCNRGGRILGNTTFSQTCLQAHTHIVDDRAIYLDQKKVMYWLLALFVLTYFSSRCFTDVS